MATGPESSQPTTPLAAVPLAAGPLPTAEVEKLIYQAVEAWNQGGARNSNTNNEIASIASLTPDASLRRYFRVHLRTAAVPASSPVTSSVVAMYFDSITAAEAGIGPVLQSDFAYVELTKFFLSHQVQVAKLLHDARQHRLLLIEDLGDVLIGNLIGKLAMAELEQVYVAAIEQLLKIQAIPTNESSLPSTLGSFRSFSRELFLKEMLETVDFFLPAFGAAPAVQSELTSHLSLLAERVDSLPKKFAHRDFHSWNLMWWQNKLRVIDFQDALLAPRTYDLISLLHDRDTDQALGPELVQKLANTFKARSQFGEDFALEYALTLLQRDFKVVGRFAKLVTVRKLPHYARWIPGTFRRVLANLQRLTDLTGENKWETCATMLSGLVGSDPGAPFSI